MHWGGGRRQLVQTTGGAKILAMVRHKRASKDKQVEVENLSWRTGAWYAGEVKLAEIINKK